MKTIQVEIEGTSALLMHSPKMMLEKALNGLNDELKSTKKGLKYDLKKEAENAAYRMKSGELFIPAEAIYGCLIQAASFYKIQKKSANSVIAGTVRINPGEIGLGTKKYEIDLRTVCIQRSRIVRARPKLNKWKAQFEIIYNNDMISDPNILKAILTEGGLRIGILDFSPRHKGSFGCFKIKSWKVK